MRIGVHENISAEQNKSKYPGVTLERLFIGPGVLSPQNLILKVDRLVTPYLQNQITPVVSFKPHHSDVAAGRWDSYLRNLVNTFGDTVWFCIYHEPEDNLNGTDFTKMFNRCFDVMKDADQDSIQVYAAMAYQWRPGSRTTVDPTKWLPRADYYACDVYSGRSFPLSTTLPDHAGFKRWKANLPAGQQWGITERGFETANLHEARAATLKQDIEWATTNDCSFYIYWNTTGTEKSDELVLDPLGEASLKEAIREVAPVYQRCPTCHGSGRIQV